MLDAVNGVTVWRLAEDGPVLGSYASATDLIGELYGREVTMVVIPVSRLDPEFFRLGSGIAGAFMEKPQQYGLRLAIVGDIAPLIAKSGPLRDFVRETNRHGRHLFARDEVELRERLRG